MASCETRCSQESLHKPDLHNGSPYEDVDDNIRYARTPKRVPRRYNTPKRVKYIYYSVPPLMRLADLSRFSRI